MTKATWWVKVTEGLVVVVPGTCEGVVIGRGVVAEREAAVAVEWLNHYTHFNS